MNAFSREVWALAKGTTMSGLCAFAPLNRFHSWSCCRSLLLLLFTLTSFLSLAYFYKDTYVNLLVTPIPIPIHCLILLGRRLTPSIWKCLREVSLWSVRACAETRRRQSRRRLLSGFFFGFPVWTLFSFLHFHPWSKFIITHHFRA